MKIREVFYRDSTLSPHGLAKSYRKCTEISFEKTFINILNNYTSLKKEIIYKILQRRS